MALRSLLLAACVCLLLIGSGCTRSLGRGVIDEVSFDSSSNDGSTEDPSRGEQFLLTKSSDTYELGCGPPDDFDCGLNRYSGYMALANIKAYENTNNRVYLDYAIQFASTEQTNPPDWCHSCTCLPPEDFDCGMGEVQAEMMEVFARLYEHTGNEEFLRYAQTFANTTPTDPPITKEDTLCGPPDDFDCGEAHVQSAYLGNYRRLFEITGDQKYLSYIGRLGEAWQDKTIEEKGPKIVTIFLGVASITGEEHYEDRAINLGQMLLDSCSEFDLNDLNWNREPFADYDESVYVDALVNLYGRTGEENLLDCAENILGFAPQCQDNICRNMVQQASMIRGFLSIYQMTGSEKYLVIAEDLARQEKLNAVSHFYETEEITCQDYECVDAEDQAFIAQALLELEAVKEGDT